MVRKCNFPVIVGEAYRLFCIMNLIRYEILLTKRTDHVDNRRVENNLSYSDNDIRVQNSEKREKAVE